MAKFKLSYLAYSRTPIIGKNYWLLVPQVGHMLMGEHGFDVIAKVLVTEIETTTKFAKIKPLKVVFSYFDLNTTTSWPGDFFYTEEEVYNFTNKDLVIRLMFEGIDLLEKKGAIAAKPKPKPKMNTQDLILKLNNLDDNQHDSLYDIFDEIAKGNESIFDIDNMTHTTGTVKGGKYFNVQITLPVKKGSLKKAEAIIASKLNKVLKLYKE
jgi:hypothetical protein